MIDDRQVRREMQEFSLRGRFTVPQLRDGQVSTAPDGPGIYSVWRVAETAPRFAKKSTAGHYLGREPTIDVEELQARWVVDAALLYVAKSANVRTRVRLLIDFADGKPVGHWGGRALWQLADADDLLVAWAANDDPGSTLAAVLAHFAAKHGGALPFAIEVKKKAAGGNKT